MVSGSYGCEWWSCLDCLLAEEWGVLGGVGVEEGGCELLRLRLWDGTRRMREGENEVMCKKKTVERDSLSLGSTGNFIVPK